MMDSMKVIARENGAGVQGFSEGKARTGQPFPEVGCVRRNIVEGCRVEFQDSIAEPPNHRTTDADTCGAMREMKSASTENRETAKASFRDILSLKSHDYAGGEGVGLGGSVVPYLGEWMANVGEAEADLNDPFRLLPEILRQYAMDHAKTNGISPICASAAAIAGLSSAIGKGVHLVSRRQRVHPNLAILNCAPSGRGKKAFHEPVEIVARILERIEYESQIESNRYKAKLKQVERRIDQLSDKAGMESADESELAALKSSAERLRSMATQRNLTFGEDMTPPVCCRSIVAPGQGGACVISSGEGSKFFSRFAGSSRNDTGYGTLLTQGFNDPSYKVSRVDERELTHNVTLDPRIFLTLSIQNAKVPAAIGMIGEDLGVFQRMLYVIEERRTPPMEESDDFDDEESGKLLGGAYVAMVESIAMKCWQRSAGSVELRYSDEAKARRRKLRYENDCLAYNLESSNPRLSCYVARWTEQVLKLIPSFHVAACVDPSSGVVDWKKVEQPVSLATLENVISFHEIWRRQTERFFELWISEQKTGIEKGLTVAKVREKLNHLMAKKNLDGIPMSILQTYFAGSSADEIRRFIEAHPGSFQITQSKARGAPLYSPIVNAAELIDFIEEGGRRAA